MIKFKKPILSRIIVIAKFDIKESILFDEIKLIAILNRNLELVILKISDMSVLSVFAYLLMNHSYKYRW